MAIFFTEENKSLSRKSFELPKYLKKHLGEYSSIKQQFSKSPGYKKLQHLLDPCYNDRSKGKKTQGQNGVPYGSLKRLKNAFKYSAPNSIEYNLMGGEEMKQWVDGTLKRERTKVKPTLPSKTSKPHAPKPTTPNAAKPPKPTVKESKKSIIISEEHLNVLKNQYNKNK